MKPNSVVVTSLMYRRPGLNKIGFVAEYDTFKRRGVVVYDTINGKFLSHTSDVELLALLCVSLAKPSTAAR